MSCQFYEYVQYVCVRACNCFCSFTCTIDADSSDYGTWYLAASCTWTRTNNHALSGPHQAAY